jgi:hypothetical protein
MSAISNPISRRNMLTAAAGASVLSATTLAQAQTADSMPETRRPGRGGDDPGVVSFHRRRVVIGRAWQSHQTASFGDGDAVGPVITDVIALLGRGAFLSAPFRNSISSACLPTMRSSAAIFASYS